MCQFFSCVSDGKGDVMYFDAEMRRRIIAGETEYQDTDSHTSIAHWYGFRGRDEDTLNKYEYNPLTKEFVVDQLNNADDSRQAEAFCKALDFSTVVPELVIKPIIHPLRDIGAGAVGEREVELLKAWASVWASVWDSVGASVWDSVGDSVFGNHDAQWLGFYDFFGEVLNLDVSKLNGLTELAKCCGWWIPYENVCILQDRPLAIHKDNQGRLHNENGMAVEYRDSWGAYLWHGVRVPEYVILEPNKITTHDIVTEQNAEIRRAKMFQYGLTRFIEDSGAKLEQSDGYGELYRIETPGGEIEKFVKVVNGTPEPDGSYKDYILPTWPNVQTAHEAVARSYNRQVAEYAPEVRT